MKFLEDYFIRPVLDHTGYNLVNTIVYAAVLVIVLFAVYKILVKMNIKFDTSLWLDLLPFVFLGGALRALQDINFFGFLGVYHALFVTPMIYIIIFLLAFAGIMVSKYIWKNFIRYFGIGLAITAAMLVLVNARNPMALVLIISVAAISYAALHFVLKYSKVGIMGKWSSCNSQIISAHLLDASAAFVAVSVLGGYKESSVFTSFLFSQIGGWIFIPVKIAVVLLALYFLDKDNKDDMAWLLKFAVLVLGLGPGIHDTFSAFIGSNIM
ncbi:DUF63 family protein [archaeon]|nr:DUF63 family protein [archaeon]